MSAFDATTATTASGPVLAKSLATVGTAMFALLQPSSLDGVTAVPAAKPGDGSDDDTSAFGAIDPLTTAQAENPRFVADDIRALPEQEADEPLLRCAERLGTAGDRGAATAAMLRRISFLDA